MPCHTRRYWALEYVPSRASISREAATSQAAHWGRADTRHVGIAYLGHCLLGIAAVALVVGITCLLLDTGQERVEALAIAVVAGAIGFGLNALDRRCKSN